ncbi:phage major capsid protein [Maricaulis sp.]|uniref:phage major capsid protein n=1 Tax=Maricaulis sp. TaxID=1486257 RepID=UPI003A8DC13F
MSARNKPVATCLPKITKPNFAVMASLHGKPEPVSVTEAVNSVKAAFEEFRERNEARYSQLADATDRLAKDLARQTLGGSVGGGSDVAASVALKPFASFIQNGARAAMSVGSDPNGGYTVTPEVDGVIQRFAQDLSPMRRRCRVQSTTANAYQVLFSKGGTGTGWVGETSARTAKDASNLARLEYPCHEVYAYPEITQNLLDDSSFDIERFTREEIVEAFDDQESAAFVTGDGVEKPKGFLSYDTATTGDATRPFGTIQYFSTGSASGFPELSGGGTDADALYNAVYGLASKYRSRGVWQMNSATAGAVRKMKDGEGRPLWADSLAEGQPNMLIGYPVELNEDMQDIGSNAYPIAFADWSRAYIIIDRLGIRVIRDDLTNKPYVGFYTTKRVGGGVVDSRAIKLIKTAG